MRYAVGAWKLFPDMEPPEKRDGRRKSRMLATV